MSKYLYILLFAICTSLCASPANAQVGDCEPAEGEAYLDAGNIRARIPNNGGLFWRRTPHVYEVPKGLGKHSIFVASIWVVGMVDNELRAAASRYGPWEFWPGSYFFSNLLKPGP